MHRAWYWKCATISLQGVTATQRLGSQHCWPAIYNCKSSSRNEDEARLTGVIIDWLDHVRMQLLSIAVYIGLLDIDSCYRYLTAVNVLLPGGVSIHYCNE